jgi:hypothetical protein
MSSRCLPPDQTARFYRIWFALLSYVNEQRHLMAAFPVRPADGSVQTEDAVLLRDALWADDSLLEGFLAENPAQCSQADLALVESWRHRLAGTFFVVRALKAYTIFLSDRAPGHAYGVLGLTSPIEETVPLPLPIVAQAVLLPFEGQIIYDSLFSSYPVTFGPGYRRHLGDLYRNLQEREGVITSLLPGEPLGREEQRSQAQKRIVKTVQAFRAQLTRAGLTSKTVEQHVATIESFAQIALLSQVPPRTLLEMTPEEMQTYLHTSGSGANSTSFKRFVRFLLETERMECEDVEALQEVLKQAR